MQAPGISPGPFRQRAFHPERSVPSLPCHLHPRGEDNSVRSPRGGASAPAATEDATITIPAAYIDPTEVGIGLQGWLTVSLSAAPGALLRP